MDTMLPTPRRALIELADRRERMLAAADGRVLDVAEVVPSRLAQLEAAGEVFATVVSVLQISTARDAGAMCRTLRNVLAPDGVLVFLEPTVVPGIAGAVQHALGPWVRRTAGRRPDLDITALLRAADLSVVDCERFTA